MLAKISAATLEAIGAESAADFESKLTAFIAEANKNKTSMAATQVTLESLQASLTALEGKLLSEDRIKTIAGESATAAITAWAGSEAGKKIVGAEASRITMEAIAAIGTAPAKPAPAPAAGNDTPEQKAAALIAEGKFEDAWKMDANLRREFLSPKSYAAFMRANKRGAVLITNKTK